MLAYLVKEIEDEEAARELSKLLCWPIDLVGWEVIIEIEYKMYGKYLQATYYEPAEYPELEVIKVSIVEISNRKTNVGEKQLQVINCSNFINLIASDEEITSACFEDYERIDAYGGYYD
jgi:hypothetical protein